MHLTVPPGNHYLVGGEGSVFGYAPFRTRNTRGAIALAMRAFFETNGVSQQAAEGKAAR
jgi:hypothetical protein